MKHPFLVTLLLISFAACSQNASTSFRNADNKRFAEEMKGEDAVVLDVRTPEEYNEGHIPNAVLINFHDADFAEQLEPLNKNKTYLVYCAAGGRSSKASALMTEKGFKQVYNLQGGYSKWDGEKVK